MELNLPYNKQRKFFGKPYFFSLEGPKIHEDLKPNKSLAEKYIYKNPVCKSVQVSSMISENEVNTPIKELADRGMNHLEGGWPKEIDTNDEEAVLRFRKKVERLDSYVGVMQRLTPTMEHAIMQNNAVNIYQKYFEETSFSEEKEVSIRIQSRYKDPKRPTRSIMHCSWSPEGTEFCVSHCNTQYQGHFDDSNESYIWDLESPLAPLLSFESEVPLLCLEYNPRDHHWLAGGFWTGQVGNMDSRVGGKPVVVSAIETSHRDPAHSVLWISSKSGMEFFSTSADGVVKWWDSRKLNCPIDEIILDVSRGEKPNITNSHPASCLEYDPSIPAKYMVGTDNGFVICGNRKGTNQQDKLSWIVPTNVGPVFSIHRNQGFAKNFLTVGSWSVKIWSEDCKDSPIIWTKKYNTKLSCGEWSPGRLSVFFVTRADGVLDIWDILVKQKIPSNSVRLCNDPLTTLRTKEDGLMLLVGTTEGSTFLLKLPSDFAESSKNDKNFLSAMFDRESRREKLLESRNREIKLRLREQMIAKEAEEQPRQKTEFEIQVEDYKEALENDYFVEIENSLKIMEKRKDGEKPEVKEVEEAN